MMLDKPNLIKMRNLVKYVFHSKGLSSIKASPMALQQMDGILHQFYITGVDILKINRRELIFLHDLIIQQNRNLLRGRIENDVLKPLSVDIHLKILKDIKAMGCFEPKTTTTVGIPNNPYKPYPVTKRDDRIIIEPGMRLTVGAATYIIRDYFRHK